MDKHQNPSLWRWAGDCPTLHPEVTKDCILPDLYPDIHKILYTTADCVAGKTVLQGGKMQTAGALHCKVLFADEEGNLHEVHFQMDYDGQAPYSAEDGEECLAAQTDLESITARALNPRKLSLRAKLTVTPMLFYQCPDQPRMASELSDIVLEKKLCSFTAWQISTWGEQGIEAGEDLSLSHESSMGRLVYSDLTLQAQSCNAGEGEVRFSGNGILSLLYTTPEGALRTADLSFPIQSSVRGNVAPDALCKVTLTPETVSVVPSEDATGEVRGVELDFTYSIQIIVARRMISVRPVDCYSVSAPTKAEEETVELLSDLRPISREFSRNMEGDSDGMTDLLKGFSHIWVDAREKTSQGVCLHCTAQVTLIGKDGAGAPMSLQLVENFQLEGETQLLCMESFSATPSAVIDGDRVKVRLQGRMDAFGGTGGTCTFVGAVLPAVEQHRFAGDTMTLCYPAKGETLWEIAKRYRTTQSALLSANNLGEGELPAVLLVPRG